MIDKLLKIAGKDGFKIDERISRLYLYRLIWKYGRMMLKGRIAAAFNKRISKKVFIGKKVKLIEKQYMEIGCGTKIHDRVKIDALSVEGVKIGKNVVIGHDTVIECTGSIADIGKGITIGDGSTFGSDCFFGAAGGIVIGKDVVAGQNIRMHSENHNFDRTDILIKDQGVTREGIKIGNNCWIGAGAVFTDGAEIKDGCVVAANAVVTGKFPENSVIGGVPAKIIKTRGL